MSIETKSILSTCSIRECKKGEREGEKAYLSVLELLFHFTAILGGTSFTGKDASEKLWPDLTGPSDGSGHGT